MKYYYSINNKILGPVEKEYLRGIITRETFIWMQGLKNWKRASEISELFSIFEDTPPPLPSLNKVDDVKAVDVKILKNEKPTFTPEKEVKIAKEIQLNIILLLAAIIISFFASVFYYEYNSGAIKSLQMELGRYSNIPHGNIIGSAEEYDRFDRLIDVSRSLDCYPDGKYFGLDIVPKIFAKIEVKLDYVFDESKKFGFYTLLISLTTLIIGRYLIKSVKWVMDRVS